MIEIHSLRSVDSTDVDDGHTGVVELLLGWIPPLNRCAVLGNQNANGEEVVFVSASGMGKDGSNHLRESTRSTPSRSTFWQGPRGSSYGPR